MYTKHAKIIRLLLASWMLMPIFSGTTLAQSCGGSLGAAVFTENFGTPDADCYGSTALGSGVTDYSFRDRAGASGNSDNGNPPNDGQYVIWCSSAAPVWNWGLWHQTYADHTTGTGTGTGSNMAIFNLHGSVGTNGELFKKAVTGLCQNTNYTVTLYIANLADSDNETAVCGGPSLLPSLNIVVYNSGTTTVKASVATGNIPTSSNFTWIPYSLTFTTSAGQTSVDLSFQNLIGAGCGNDIAIDDITFQPCGPLLTNSASPSNSVTEGTSVTFNGNIGTGYTSPVYQWQSSTDGITWTDISGATSINYTISSPVVADSKQYRLLTAESGNISNTSCRINSNAVALSVSTPLAIRDNRLEALYISENVVELLWKSNEMGDCKFDVYGSYDGINYILLNTLNCQPNTEQYSYEHEFSGNGSMNYFKVREYGTNSEYDSWSNVVYAENHITNKVVLFPNPVNANAVLTIHATRSILNKVEIFDVNGKLINTLQTNDKSTMIVYIGDLLRGLYFAKIETMDGILHEKLIVE